MSHWLERAWYRRSPWLKLLRPLSALYTCIVQRRRDDFITGARSSRVWKAPVPVLVVGNISVGGTGKTPLVMALIHSLRAQGWSPGVVSRGYGATPPAYPWCVRADHSPACVGDEPLLLVQRTGVPLVIDPDRVAATQALLDSHHCDLIISDDGLQHYALGRDLELAVIDAQRGLGNGRCLPEGPLREPPSRLASVDYVIINGSASDWPGAHTMRLQVTGFRALKREERLTPAQWCQRFSGQMVTAIAGIGNPQRFVNTLTELGIPVRLQAFADHHAYRADDFKACADTLLLMTEKDAVKCHDFDLPHAWVVEVEAILATEFTQALHQRLRHLSDMKGNLHGSETA